MATRAVPIIDISDYYSGNLEQKIKVAEEIGKACAEVGFFLS